MAQVVEKIFLEHNISSESPGIFIIGLTVKYKDQTFLLIHSFTVPVPVPFIFLNIYILHILYCVFLCQNNFIDATEYIFIKNFIKNITLMY